MKYLLFSLSLLTLWSCSQEPMSLETETLQSRRSGNNYGIVHVADLYAGQNILIGSVEVANYNDQVYVTYKTNGDWSLKKTHLFVGDYSEFPMNNGGNPQVGRFPYKRTHPNGTQEFTHVGPEVYSSMCYFHAAHAEVVNANGQSESAWADGDPLGGNSWAMGFEQCY